MEAVVVIIIIVFLVIVFARLYTDKKVADALSKSDLPAAGEKIISENFHANSLPNLQRSAVTIEIPSQVQPVETDNHQGEGARIIGNLEDKFGFTGDIGDSPGIRTIERPEDYRECKFLSSSEDDTLILERIENASSQTQPVQIDSHRREDTITSRRFEPDHNKSTTNSKGFWVPAGKEVTVAGTIIKEGLIFVGQVLGSVENPIYGVEPALINPTLPVDFSKPDMIGTTMTYWPSYTKLEPAARAAYLHWLAEGRKDPNAAIGYVFLFFYGLERRLFYDAQHDGIPHDETNAIILEVERLLTIYGNNSSFRRYALVFLEVAQIMFSVDSILIEPPKRRQSDEMPLALKIGIGRFINDGKPVPSEWAFSWLEYYPSSWFRTPAQRCRDEFFQLFQVRYKKIFGDGIIISTERKNILQLNYCPASSSFTGKTISVKVKNIPDVFSDNTLIKPLQGLANSCIEELDAYSRYVYKAETRKSLSAFALLPADLLLLNNYRKIAQLQKYIQKQLDDKALNVSEAKSLLQLFAFEAEENLTKQQCVTIAQLISKLGYGIEPDIRFQDEKIEVNGKIVLFQQDSDAPSSPTPSYKAASLIMRLAGVIIFADGEVNDSENEHLEKHIESVLGLTAQEQQRLRAYLFWLLSTPVDYSGLKKRLSELNEEQRRSIANFLIEVANADGRIEPEEIKVLKKIYTLLQLESSTLYSDIHAIQTSVDDEPVTMLTGLRKADSYKIPPRIENNIAILSTNKINLRMDVVEKKLRETEKVQGILSEIFQASDELNEKSQVVLPPRRNDIMFKTLPGLDPQHSKLVKNIIAKPNWTRIKFESLCDEYGLLPEGALENINGASLDHYGDTLIEDGEILQTNQEIIKELLAA